jgi:amidase
VSDDLAFSGVRAQADAVASGDLTSVDLVRRALARIEALDGRVNAFSEVLASTALAEAAHRDAVAPDERGPLHGVPIAIKQELDVAGAVTTFGGAANTTPAAEDCEVVRRLRGAGAVIIGKTTMPEFGQWTFTESETTGITRNPWNLDRSPGGSSGGTAAAVASGMVPAAIGGDGGGSIRIPAAWCGLFGLKPSRGRVSTAPHPHLWWALGVVGPLTRSVADSALIYDVISGSLPSDLFSAPPLATPLVKAAQSEPGRLRIGWSTKSAAVGVRPTAEVVNTVKVMARRLEELGHDVREIDPHYPDATPGFVPQMFAGVRTEAAAVEHYRRLEARTRQNVRLGTWVRPAVINWAMARGDSIGRKANRVFDEVDVLLTPTVAMAPPVVPALGRGGAPEALLKSARAIAYTALWNLAGNPAASVPFGLSPGGMPLSVQLVGRHFDEATLVSLAAQIEAAHPWAQLRPPVAGVD